MIELRLKSGDDVILTPIRKNDKLYELVDVENKVHMRLKLKDHSLIIDKNYDLIEEEDDNFEVKLNNLFTEIITNEQSGVDDNENHQDSSSINPYNPGDIRVNANQFSIKLIHDMIEEGDIDINPDFQRNFVWDSNQKSRLIESLLLRIPLPVFYFAEDKENKFTIIDGLQRLTTIRQFMNNEFPLRNLEYLDEGVAGRYYKTDLDNNKKGIDINYYRWFNLTQLSVNIIDRSSPADVRYDIFRRINTGGRPLNDQEIRNCMASQILRDLLTDMSNLEEFKLATDFSVKCTRMADKEMALRFLAFYDAYKEDGSFEKSYNGKMSKLLDNANDKLSHLSMKEYNNYLQLYLNAMKNAKYLVGQKYVFRKITRKNTSEIAHKQLLNKALFISISVLLSDIPYDKIIEKYPENYLLEPYVNMISEDSDLRYYLSYGTNGKENIKYIFESMSILINDNIKL